MEIPLNNSQKIIRPWGFMPQKVFIKNLDRMYSFLQQSKWIINTLKKICKRIIRRFKRR